MYCKNCGSQINDEAVFCKKCGAKQTVVLLTDETKDKSDNEEMDKQEIGGNTSFGEEIETSETKQSKSDSHIPFGNKKYKWKWILIISTPILLITIILFVIFGMPQLKKTESVNVSDLNLIRAKLEENAEYFEKNIVGKYQAADGQIIEFGSDTMINYKKIPIGGVDEDGVVDTAFAIHQAEVDSTGLCYYKIYGVNDISEEGLKAYAEYIKDGEIWAFLESTAETTNVFLARLKDDILTIEGADGALPISPLTRITKENKITDDVVGLYLSESTNNTIILLKDGFFYHLFYDSTNKVFDSTAKSAFTMSGYKITNGNISIYGADNTVKIKKQGQTLVLTTGSQTETYRKISNMDWTSEFGVSIYDAKLSTGSSKNPYDNPNQDASNNSNDHYVRVVPNLNGMALEDAKQQIIGYDLVYGGYTEEENSAPKGTVLRQYPEAGTEVDSGTTVTVVVSSGKQSVDSSTSQSNNNSSTQNGTGSTEDFVPIAPEVLSVTPRINADNNASILIDITISDLSLGEKSPSHYNAGENLTITVNGTKVNHKTAWWGGKKWQIQIDNINLSDTKTFTIVLTNKYGLSTTRTVTFS